MTANDNGVIVSVLTCVVPLVKDLTRLTKTMWACVGPHKTRLDRVVRVQVLLSKTPFKRNLGFGFKRSLLVPPADGQQVLPVDVFETPRAPLPFE